jgi:hypothetical protein
VVSHLLTGNYCTTQPGNSSIFSEAWERKPTSPPPPSSTAAGTNVPTHEFAHVVAESFSQLWESSSQSQSDSSCPSTPSLSFSPESIESSSDGDRTIQTSSFIDVSTPPNGYFTADKRTQKILVLPPFINASGDFPFDSNPGLYPHYNGVSLPFSGRDKIHKHGILILGGFSPITCSLPMA